MRISNQVVKEILEVDFGGGFRIKPQIRLSNQVVEDYLEVGEAGELSQVCLLPRSSSSLPSLVWLALTHCVGPTAFRLSKPPWGPLGLVLDV